MYYFLSFIPQIISSFSGIFSVLFSPVLELLNKPDNLFLKFFYDLANVIGIDSFLSDTTLISFVLGSGLIIVISVNILKWLIP